MIPNQGEDAAAERNTTAVERNGRTVNVKGKPTSIRKQGGDGEMAKERKGQSTSIIGWDEHILASIKKEREEEKKLLQKNKKYNGWWRSTNSWNG